MTPHALGRISAGMLTGKMITTVAVGYIDVSTGRFAPFAQAEAECVVRQNDSGAWELQVPAKLELVPTAAGARTITHIGAFIYDQWSIREIKNGGHFEPQDAIHVKVGFALAFPKILLPEKP